MRQLNPVATSAHCMDKYNVNSSIKSFLSVYSLKPPLCQPYTGPHKVISRTNKIVNIELNGLKFTVTLDIMKLAYLITNSSEPKDIKETKTVAGKSANEQFFY
ncbi:reverse transcriptase [Caerostris darwini]|uniref:Reverse transcriptase n=1 Tax=Caerostris darwini TaxID=1538125 RepID=A0AAV4V2X3_9ARAC|nr:reverse transcriptase [Caerostris darwini]